MSIISFSLLQTATRARHKTQIRFVSLPPGTLIHGAIFLAGDTKIERAARKMSEVAAAGPFVSSRQQVLLHARTAFIGGQWKVQLKPTGQCRLGVVAPAKSPPQMMTQVVKPATYSSTITTDIPLFETPGASFDEYLEDKPRVFKAMFPDTRRSRQLNEEEWRVKMLPLEFLFLTVWPVVDVRLRCRTKGEDHPPEIPRYITRVLELDITRWELRGLDSVLKPSHFTLGVKGALYSDRHTKRSHLKGRLEMNISFVLPLALALVPEDVRKSVAESVLRRLVENMKHQVNSSLLADYGEFRRERHRNLV